MTMHLLPIFVTSTSLKKPKKVKSSLTKLEKSKLEHELWVYKMTKGKKADKKVLDKLWKQEYNDTMVVDKGDYVSAGIEGNCVKPEPKVYTGGNLVGIATMHKSNMVPIFKENKEHAIDIANMRR